MARKTRLPVMSTDYPMTAMGIDYAERVVAGEIPACTYAVQSCQRLINDLALAQSGKGQWEFRPGPAEAAMLTASSFVNIKGPLAGSLLNLMPWQCFIFAAVFGFYERNTDARRFRQAIVYVPRGNGKSSLCAPLVLYAAFCEGEGGAEAYAAAVTRSQARIVFDTAQEMVRRSPEFRSAFGVAVLANALYQERSASSFKAISSDAKALDGLNVHIAVCDEIASHKTAEVYNVLQTALGKRQNPMLVCISTATGNNAGIGRQLWDYLVRVLAGAQTDDRLFGVIYTADPTDDLWAEETWIKANPGWGITVQPDAIRAIMSQARNNPSQEAAALTKHLNVWTSVDNALFSVLTWRDCAKPTLDLADFEGAECHIALDLASKIDLASVALVFPSRTAGLELRYDLFCRNYLNETAVLEARNASYPGWAKAGFLTITEGNETDFSRIEDDLLEFMRRFRVLSVAYDPWAATQFAQRMLAQDVPMVEFRATTQNFTEPTKELEAAMRSGRVAHSGDPVLEWCIGNVVGRYDARDNVYPKKNRSDEKIDAAIATIMGIGRCMTGVSTRSRYEDREEMTFV